MLRKALIALGLLATATSARATVMTSFAAGLYGVQAGETLIADFDNSLGGVTLNNAGLFTGLSPNVAAPPAGDTTKYLAVLAGGSADFVFGPVSRISFDLGSLDNYNTILVSLLGSATPVSFSGSTMTNGPADGDQFSNATNGRLTIYGSANERITGISLLSSGNSFEIDNVAVGGAVPEIGTWAMFLMGFGLLGYGARRERRRDGLETDAV